jgi:Uma2 family endonuclease
MSDIDLKNKDRDLKDQVTDLEPVSEDGKYVTEEEYWEKYYEHPDFNYEWNNGILEEIPVSDFKNITMYYWFITLLKYYFDTYKTGKVVFHDFGFRLVLPEKKSIRKPDFAVVLTNNKTDLDQDDRSFKGTYDLCIELISDLTRRAITRDTVDKKIEYEAVGVKEYYILDASNKHMAFYRLSKEEIFIPIIPVEGDIIVSDVLKGFRFRISDLFRQPSQEELTEDKVYDDFVLPSYKKSKMDVKLQKQRADDAEKRAEIERQKAKHAEEKTEMERHKAEHLAEKLHSLGISVD